MKAYVITSGGIFGVLTIAHLLRIAVENRHLALTPYTFSSRLPRQRYVSGRGACCGARTDD